MMNVFVYISVRLQDENHCVGVRMWTATFAVLESVCYLCTSYAPRILFMMMVVVYLFLWILSQLPGVLVGRFVRDLFSCHCAESFRSHPCYFSVVR